MGYIPTVFCSWPPLKSVRVIVIGWYSDHKLAHLWSYHLKKMSVPGLMWFFFFYFPVMLMGIYLDSNFLLGNAQGCRGYPIVYCSDGFCELTGFARTEVMKKTCTCRFLHGEETSERVTQQVQKALEGQREYQAEVRYYRKNGTVATFLKPFLKVVVNLNSWLLYTWIE